MNFIYRGWAEGGAQANFVKFYKKVSKLGHKFFKCNSHSVNEYTYIKLILNYA